MKSKTWNLKTWDIKLAIWNPKSKIWKVNLNSKPENKTWNLNMKYKTLHLIRKSKPEIKNLKYKAWNLNPEIKTWKLWQHWSKPEKPFRVFWWHWEKIGQSFRALRNPWVKPEQFSKVDLKVWPLQKRKKIYMKVRFLR